MQLPWEKKRKRTLTLKKEGIYLPNRLLREFEYFKFFFCQTRSLKTSRQSTLTFYDISYLFFMDLISTQKQYKVINKPLTLKVCHLFFCLGKNLSYKSAVLNQRRLRTEPNMRFYFEMNPNEYHSTTTVLIRVTYSSVTGCLSSSGASLGSKLLQKLFLSDT